LTPVIHFINSHNREVVRGVLDFVRSALVSVSKEIFEPHLKNLVTNITIKCVTYISSWLELLGYQRKLNMLTEFQFRSFSSDSLKNSGNIIFKLKVLQL
jgi:hypothetical protein